LTPFSRFRDETIVTALRKRGSQFRPSAFLLTVSDVQASKATAGRSPNAYQPPSFLCLPQTRHPLSPWTPSSPALEPSSLPTFPSPPNPPRFRVPVSSSTELPRIPVPSPTVPLVQVGPSHPPRPSRASTYFQPKAFDPSYSRNGAQPIATHPNGSSMLLPMPESSRSTSPQYVARVIDTKPTQLPKVTGLARTSSSSSHDPHQPSSIDTVISDSRHGHPRYTPSTPESTLEMWKGDETVHAAQPSYVLQATLLLAVCSTRASITLQPSTIRRGDAAC
jgi:hypothetical protein